LLETLRTGSNDAACDHVVKLINGGAAPKSIWDAYLAANILKLRGSLDPDNYLVNRTRAALNV
jgi:hypothetical protein